MKAIPTALRPPGLVLCGLLLLACAGCGTRVAGDADLGAAVKSHYDARAMEEGGRCRTPELTVVTSSSVQERTADHLVVRVGYAYTDPIDRATGQCRGFSTRSFTVAKTADGFEVLEMTGPRREGIRIKRIERSGWW